MRMFQDKDVEAAVRNQLRTIAPPAVTRDRDHVSNPVSTISRGITMGSAE